MSKNLKQYCKVKKPWGWFEQFVKEEPVTVKIIAVKPQEALSLQYHNYRREYWRILSGEGEVSLGDTVLPAKAGDEYFIAEKQTHRIKAGNSQVKILEISFGKFDENDIVRLEDKYKRND